MNHDDTFVVRLEGVVGAGKSSLLEYLKKKYKGARDEIDFVPEPVKEWMNFYGHDLLTEYYDGRISPAVFQIHALMELVFLHQKRPKKKLRIIEQSVAAGRYIFLELQKEENLISECEYLIIKNIYQEILKSDLGKNLRTDVTFYIRTDPRIAFDRMMRRGRKAEANVSLSYLQKLQKKYDEWLIQKIYPESQPIVRIINSNASLSIWTLSLKKVVMSSDDETKYLCNYEY